MNPRSVRGTRATGASSSRQMARSGAPRAASYPATAPSAGPSSSADITRTYPNLCRLAWGITRLIAAVLLAWALVLMLARVASTEGGPQPPEPPEYWATTGTPSVYATFPTIVPYACVDDGSWRIALAGASPSTVPWTVTLGLETPWQEWFTLDLPLSGQSYGYLNYTGGSSLASMSRLGYVMAIVGEGWHGHIYVMGGPCNGYGQPPTWQRTLSGWR